MTADLALELPPLFPSFNLVSDVPVVEIEVSRALTGEEHAELGRAFDVVAPGHAWRVRTKTGFVLAPFRHTIGDGDIDLIPSRLLATATPVGVRLLCEEDDDFWMKNRVRALTDIDAAASDFLPAEFAPGGSRCFVSTQIALPKNVRAYLPRERQRVLAAMQIASSGFRGRDRVLSDEFVAGVRESWNAFELQTHRRGAAASGIDGIARIVSSVAKVARGRDVQLEMMTAAAPVEWAAALGATVFPGEFGGYSEQPAIELCAAVYSGVPARAVGVQVGQVETVLSGLLSIDNDAPVLELETALRGRDVERLQRVVSELLDRNPNLETLEEAITAFNAEVRRFESRAEKLNRWDVVGLLGAVVPLALTDHPAAATIVPLGAWLLKQLLAGGGPTGGVFDEIQARSVFSRRDVVLVSRVSRAAKARS